MVSPSHGRSWSMKKSSSYNSQMYHAISPFQEFTGQTFHSFAPPGEQAMVKKPARRFSLRCSRKLRGLRYVSTPPPPPPLLAPTKKGVPSVIHVRHTTSPRESTENHETNDETEESDSELSEITLPRYWQYTFPEDKKKKNQEHDRVTNLLFPNYGDWRDELEDVWWPADLRDLENDSWLADV